MIVSLRAFLLVTASVSIGFALAIHEPAQELWLHDLPEGPLVARGAALFDRFGCFSCHGVGGEGGVVDFNYAKETVPDLVTLAERLGIFWPEDAEVAIDLLERNVALGSLEDDPPFERYGRFVAQVENVRNVIRGGSTAASLDESAPAPPLNMPAWERHLSDRDINALIAWGISLFPWEDLEDDEESGEEPDESTG